MKKILVPTDFSEVSENALKFAIQLAKVNDAEITLLNSIHFDYFHDFQYAATSLQSMISEVKEAVEARMAKFVDQFKNEGVPIRHHIDSGDLISQIKDMVEQERFELVIVGTKGCSGLEEVFVGSNTEKVVRNIPCPVIAIPLGYTFGKIRKILIPIDIRETKDTFLRQIFQLQRQFDAELEFVWVKTPHNIENQDQLSEEFNDLLKSYGLKNYRFIVVNNIFPSDGILIHAYDSKADMIAMATHARRGIAHWLSGSLTEDTVNHIDAPVWTFKLQKGEKSIDFKSVQERSRKAEYKVLPIPSF